MLALSEQATAILARIATIPGFNQVEYLDDEAEVELRPANYPAAQLVMARVDMSGQANRGVDADSRWTGLVTGKRMGGQAGILVLIDALLDTLCGFALAGNVLPLYPKEIEYVKNVNQASVYAVTFTTSQRGKYQPRT